ncbi:hypothetical protein PVL29_023228 [Vitis rotundifolia]|uniref:DSP-PTPase phosphatase fused to NAD+ Kinase domain-containing protein n=1 Tax=Vitis rotundifolia TaxID=103349 RepID=A0AA39D8X2_VITRO|nr:hypothetical protein PVL29_023228 [Vitis rotundifolia]
MVVCGFWVCRVVVVDMNPSYSPITGVSNLTPYKLPPFFTSRGAVKLFGFGSQRKAHLRRRLKLVVSAELSNPFSLSFGLDSQAFRSHDLSQLPWIGPVPGDIAEVEAYCRIFRAAEWLHCALMDALCNPLTGECSVSYDFTSEEKPLLEDKIVSVLGCMLSLLNKGKEDVLSGRSSIMSSFRVADVSATEDKLPPLAIFRGEMKRCCESLHFALENYLTPDDDRSFDVWRKLQRLKNVCYDSGFPRGDDYPSHMLFANWNPVYLSTSKEDMESKEAAFWSGGQVTEEGLKWLIDKGYKTIVDLRAENVKDIFYEAVVHDAVLSGKVELVKFPVEARTAPSMEQVEKFASLVSDSSKKPIYLHSKEGAWRTSAMVSRWRQYMARSALQFVSNQPIIPNEILSRDPDGREELHVLSDSLQQSLDTINSSNGVFHDQVSRAFDNKEQSSNGAYNSHSSQGMAAIKNIDNGVGSQVSFCREIDPLKSQFPPCDVFSKKEMTRFLRSKKITPPTYFNYQQKGFENLPVLGETCIGTRQRSKTNGTGSASRLVETGGSNGSLSRSNVSPKAQSSAAANGALKNDDSCVSVGSTVNGFYKGERCSMTGSDGSSFVNNKLNKDATSTTVREDQKSHDKASIVSGDDGLGQIEGNMCASTTGVVRIQSRKKAEMFLVRTDGFSCTREKVTESSLAFTHPSTQQQMLMWKSTPKTVLLLKKLGQALMEEAKENPGFGFVQTFYTQDTSDLHERVDFVACLGGDGVILHASNLFRDAVPPVVSFNLGSLGFLTSHTFEDYRQDLRQIIHGNSTLDGVYITLRMRLRCEIFRDGNAMPGKIFDVLNEIVVDRGSNPYLSKIECYEHDRLITKVQGDGVIVATPTGSTAYSTSAGGSMVHPNVPCMLFTPICPHSLSFRPVILPDSARLELKIPKDARSNAWVSFDGKRRQQLSRGDSVRISMSQHPLPTVNKSDQTGDWFHSLVRCLNWNERLDQKAL